MSMSKDVESLRLLLGGLSYDRKFQPNLAKCLQPLTALLKRGVAINLTPAILRVMR